MTDTSSPQSQAEHPSEFDDLDPGSECDLIMKGGITSGVVYPYAVTEIAKKYQLRSIGGTSAGAIAAAFAAAAEFARSGINAQTTKPNADPGGYSRLQQHCEKLPTILVSLFHPQQRFTGLFKLLLRRNE